MTKIVILKFLREGKKKEPMSDILKKLFFFSENWISYYEVHLPHIVTSQWKSYYLMHRKQMMTYPGLKIDDLRIHFANSLNLTNPIIDTLKLKLGDDGHTIKFWNSQGMKCDPMFVDSDIYKNEYDIRHDNALALTVSGPENEVYSLLYDILRKMGYANYDYRVEAIYTI